MTARAGSGRGRGEGRGRDPDRDDGVTISGGAGGTRACLEALAAGSARVAGAVERLAAAAASAQRVADAVAATAELAPDSARHAHADVGALLRGPHGLPAQVEALGDLAAGLRASAEIYARADQDAAALLRPVSILAGGMLGDLGERSPLLPGAAILGTLGLTCVGQVGLTARVLRYSPSVLGAGLQWLGSAEHRDDAGLLGTLARLVGGPGVWPTLELPSPRQLEGLLPALAAVVLGAAPGPFVLPEDPVETLVGLLAVVARAAAALTGTALTGLAVVPLVSAKLKDARPAAEQPPPRSVADVLRQVDKAYEAPEGTVTVQSIDRVDGSRAWVVAIPGTQDGGVGGPVPTDMLTNLELLAGRPDDRSETVIRAIKAAGVQPGEPVLLAGHSQGGMAAMRVATELDGTLTIAGVVTAGSPVGGMDLPPDVPALHLEHTQDYVWAGDGMPNPDVPNRTTVTRDLSATLDVGPVPARDLGILLLRPHEVADYVVTAEMLQGRDERSLAVFLDQVSGVIGPEPATTTTAGYLGVRVPEATSSSSGGRR